MAGGTGRPSVHTVLIRVAISWALNMNLLREFELSRVPIFSFSRLLSSEDEQRTTSPSVFVF